MGFGPALQIRKDQPSFSISFGNNTRGLGRPLETRQLRWPPASDALKSDRIKDRRIVDEVIGRAHGSFRSRCPNLYYAIRRCGR